jgi:transposase
MRKSRLLEILVTDICNRYHTSRKSYYKWKNRYLENGIDGLRDKSRKPHNIQPGKVTNEIEQEILDLRVTKRFGCNRIRFRLRRLNDISFSTRTIYKILKRHGLNILRCKIRNRKWKRFAMKKTKSNGTDGHTGTILLAQFESKKLFY